jgi:O-antigen/teichoic acid export membrane protein
MSLKRNILANYVSQIYVTLIGIVMVPMYVRYMGAEAYGLVGFFAMLQAWFNLLDMGLTPTLTRESARFYSGAMDAVTFRRLLRALQGIFFAVALLGGGAMFLSADWLAAKWLNVQLLPLNEVRLSIQLMALAVAMRWIAGLYRGCITGAERLVWLSGFNSLVATLRFGGILPVLVYLDATPTSFFTFQTLVSMLELGGLGYKSHTLFPAVPKSVRIGWSLADLISPIKPILKFALSIAFTSSIWVLVTQTDKLLLSKILPLAEYGYFTLAVLVAGGILMISAPISTAVMPRMVRQEADGNKAGVIRLYRESTQMVVTITAAATVILALFAEPILLAWTGNKELSIQVAPILVLYGIGNGIMVISGLAYLLQYARGNLRMHLIGSFGFFILLIPNTIWSSFNYGSKGAGYAWVFTNAMYLFIWVPLIHNKFQIGLNKAWFIDDVFRIYLTCSLTGYFLYLISIDNLSRVLYLAQIVIFGIITILAAAVSSSAALSKIKTWVDRK